LSRTSLSRQIVVDPPAVLQLDAPRGGTRPKERQLSLSMRVLILAKEKSIQHSCCRAAQVAGLEFVALKNTSAAYSALGSGQFGVVVLYLRWPADQGMDILERMKRLQPKIAVVVLAGYGTVQSAVYAMKLGAYDYLITPLKTEELTLALAGAVRHNRLTSEQRDDVAPTALTLRRSRNDAEKAVIFTALKSVHGNKEYAARLLGIGRTTLYQKLKKIADTTSEDKLAASGEPEHA
jgi:DNA-binding NtrC family response regulator